ncbi:MAG TPA: hypothetical protein VGI60_17340 [Chthoniobacterales bacterium]|jgi:hypothetical protein
MRLAEIFAKVKGYDEHAAVIFDRDEPIGRPTDLVLPPSRRSLFRRRAAKDSANSPNDAPSGTRS